MLYSYRWL